MDNSQTPDMRWLRSEVNYQRLKRGFTVLTPPCTECRSPFQRSAQHPNFGSKPAQSLTPSPTIPSNASRNQCKGNADILLISNHLGFLLSPPGHRNEKPMTLLQFWHSAVKSSSNSCQFFPGVALIKLRLYSESTHHFSPLLQDVKTGSWFVPL